MARATAEPARPAREAAPPAAPAPEPVPARTEDDLAASFEAELRKVAAAETGKPIIEPIARPADLAASPTELDDMTRQLQEALKRPFSGVKPASSAAALEAPAPPPPLPPVAPAEPESAPRTPRRR